MISRHRQVRASGAGSGSQTRPQKPDGTEPKSSLLSSTISGNRKAPYFNLFFFTISLSKEEEKRREKGFPAIRFGTRATTTSGRTAANQTQNMALT